MLGTTLCSTWDTLHVSQPKSSDHKLVNREKVAFVYPLHHDNVSTVNPLVRKSDTKRELPLHKRPHLNESLPYVMRAKSLLVRPTLTLASSALPSYAMHNFRHLLAWSTKADTPA